MKTNSSVSLLLGAAVAGILLSLPIWADNTLKPVPEASSSVVIGSVQIQFEVKKSTIEDLPLSRLDEEGLGEAYLPGAFEPTAAGEAAQVSTVEDNRNDNTLSNYEGSVIRSQNDVRKALIDTVASIDRSGFSRVGGNVQGHSELVSRTR